MIICSSVSNGKNIIYLQKSKIGSGDLLDYCGLGEVDSLGDPRGQ